MPDNNNTKTPPQSQEPQRSVELVRAEHYIKHYSNSAQLQVSPWDFTFVFGEVEPSTDGTFKVEQKVGVVMSPQHAKALLGILSTNIQEYEKHAGEIQYPQPTQTAVSSQIKTAAKQ